MSRRRTHSAGPTSEHHQPMVSRLRANGLQRPGATGQSRNRNLKQPQTDEELALHFAVEELRALDAREQDRAFALRLHDEEDRSRAKLLRFVRRRRLTGAARPPGLAVSLFPIPPTGDVQTAAPPRVNDEARVASNAIDHVRMFIGLVFGLNNFQPSATQPSSPRLSRREFTEAVPNRLTGHDCVSCMDPICGVEVRTPCDHYYDKECILALFTAATRDETLFPPRCCRKHIPLELVKPHMSAEALAQFKIKAKELRVERRVYCAKPSCSRFVGAQYEGVLPALLAPTLKCPAPGCGTCTCSWCKNEVAPGAKHRCEENSADRRVLALGEASGWARCPGCEAMIELTMGCYHMTCRCKTQFCYLCRARWKTCACPQWEERRLVAAAEERADVQIRLERGGGRIPIRRRPPLRLRVVNRDLPRMDEERVARRDVGGATVAVPVTEPPVARDIQADHTHEEDTHQEHALPELRQEMIDTADGTTTLMSPSRMPTSTPSSIIATASNVNWASTALTEIGSVVVEMGTANPSVAPLHWSKPSQEERERRRTLTMHWVQRLQQNHGCDHDRWTFHRGEGICAVCEEHMPVCYFRCNVCDMQVCRKCRWNRT